MNDAPPAHRRQIQQIFAKVATRYDLMNRLMTFGQDIHWRRFVIAQARLKPGDQLLDLATGTGQLAFDALQRHSDISIVGADFSAQMLEVARQHPLGGRVTWIEADALALPFLPESFDAVIQGYLLRNLDDIPQALKEQFRVLKPGGRIVVLETTPPPRNLLRPFIRLYMNVVIPLLGQVVNGQGAAYAYLTRSSQRFKSPGELSHLLSDAGFRNVQFRTFLLGTVCVHWGVKPE